MVSITVTLDDELKAKVERFSWVNWSDVGRVESIKKEIFERFLRSGTLSEDDQSFCDSIDWYPVDELQLKDGFIKELERSRREPRGKAMTVDEFEEWCNKL